MKKVLLIIAMCCLYSGIFAQSELYNKFADMDGVETVYMPNLDKLVNAVSTNEIGLDAKNMPVKISKMNTLVVVSSEKPDVIAKMKKEMTPILKEIRGDSKYELVLDTKSDGERTLMYLNVAKGEFLIINSDEAEYEIIQFFGQMSKK